MYIIFFLVKKNIKKKIKLLVTIVLFPILTTFALNFIVVKIKQQQLKSEVVVAPPSSENRYFKYTDSGRSVLWEKALTKYNYQNLFGYGPQADRRLLLATDPRKEIHHYGNNVSNGFIYAFLCGGYLSLIFYLIINFKIITNIIKNIKTINNYKNNYSIFYYKLSSTFLIFFFIRQNFENSFSIFGIDFLIVIVCTFIINKNRKFKQN
jgi:O-antigen ligase